MKKQWISVKCGLSRDPKHRQAMGESVWLFLHILDTASWDDGICHDWKDEAEAEEMGMPVRTLREHRRKLDELGYITCNQKQYTQDVIIHNWTNPREYNGQLYNPKQGDRITEPQEIGQGDIQGDTQGYIQGNRKDVTPTSNSKNQISNTGSGLTEKEIEQANAKVTAMIENSKKVTYTNRDKMPEPYLPFCDLYVELCGRDNDGQPIQAPTKRVFQDWMLTFEEWKQENLQPVHIRAAFKHATRPDGGFLVSRPGSLTNTAVAMKTRMGTHTESGPAIDADQIARTKALLAQKDEAERKSVPMPANLQRPRGIADVAKGLRK